MEPVQKTRSGRRKRGVPKWAWLAAALALLGAVIAAVLLLQASPTAQLLTDEEDEFGAGTYLSRETDEVASVAVTLRSGESWTLLQNASGGVRLADDASFAVSSGMADTLLADASTITWHEVLSDDPAEYEERLEEFGLSEPLAVVEITFTDDTAATLRIGDRSSMEEESFYYMLIDGENRLFALDVTTAEDFAVERALLHTVVQPTIHAARIDRISFVNEAGEENAWELDGDITDSDAEDRWVLTSPARYPADGESLSNLRKNLANLHLGAYVGEATEENLRKYGFDSIRFTLTIHQAAGDMQTANTSGEAVVTSWPESTLTLQLGGEKSDMVDYALYEGSIYLVSHFSLNVFMSLSPADTLTRYPVLTSLSNLSALTIEKDGRTAEYRVTRTEQVAENNDLVYDEDGNLQYDVSVTENGEEISWDSFEQAYNVLLMVTVTGTLSTGWEQTEEPHTRYTFETVTGVTHTIALTRLDALNDAVLVDGNAFFYLVKGGMTFPLGEE